jgi:hypothetical protein
MRAIFSIIDDSALATFCRKSAIIPIQMMLIAFPTGKSLVTSLTFFFKIIICWAKLIGDAVFMSMSATIETERFTAPSMISCVVESHFTSKTITISSEY